MEQSLLPNGSQILVVDDDQSLRDLLQMILQLKGFTVQVAADGKMALELLPALNHPQLILLDMMMPVMNGWQCYNALKADPRFKDIPIVIITAYSKHEIEMPSAVEILYKPIDLPRLGEIASKYCTVR